MWGISSIFGSSDSRATIERAIIKPQNGPIPNVEHTFNMIQLKEVSSTKGVASLYSGLVIR